MTGRGGGGSRMSSGGYNKYSDSYDAMQEDFENLEMNSYEPSHGVRLPYTRKKTTDSAKIKLYVGNIPLDISERGLLTALKESNQDVFNPYIHKSTDPSRSTTYGFVEVENIDAAHELIKLSRRTPHNLNISFATAPRNKEAGDGGEIPPLLSSPPQSYAGSEQGGIMSVHRGRGGGQGLMEGRRPGSYSSRQQSTGGGGGYEEETYSGDPAGAGGYLGGSTDLRQGERTVTMGRGAFLPQQNHSSLPPQLPSTLPKLSGASPAEMTDEMDALVSAYIAKQYKSMAPTVEKSGGGVGSSVKSSSAMNIVFNLGGCVSCSRPSLYVCAICKGWYCSNYCRQLDFIRHKGICRPRKVVGFGPQGELLLSEAGGDSSAQSEPDGGGSHPGAPGRRPQAERNYDDESNFSRGTMSEEGSRNGLSEGYGRRKGSVSGGRPYGGGQESGGGYGGPSRDSPRGGGGNRGYGGQDRSEGGRPGYGAAQDRPFGNKGPGGQDRSEGQGGFGGAQDRPFGNKGPGGQDRAEGQGGYGGSKGFNGRERSRDRKGGYTGGGQDRSAGKGGYNGDRAYNGGGNSRGGGGSDRTSSDGGRGGGYGGQETAGNRNTGMKNGGGGRANTQGAPGRQNTGGGGYGTGKDDSPKEAFQAPLPPPNVESEVIKRSSLSPNPVEGGPVKSEGGGGKMRQTSAEPPIPANVFSEVTVGALLSDSTSGGGGGSTKFWGYASDVLVRQADIMKELTSLSTKAQPITSQISPGLRVCAPFMDDWYRAQVLSCSGSEARVIYIDFGNEESVPVGSLRPLPSHLLTSPPLAHLFILAEGQNNPTLVDDLTVKLKPIQLVGDAWLVQAEGARYPTTSQETVEVEEEEEVEVLGCYESGDEYWVMATADLPLLGEMEERLGKHKDIKVEPTLGEIYALQLRKFWYRVELTEKCPALSVLCIDTGLKVPSVKRTDLHPIPIEYSTVPQLGFKIKLASGTPSSLFNLQVEAKFLIKPISKTAEYTVCEARAVTPRAGHQLPGSPTYSSRM